jgi:hypothetical protein
MSFAVFSLSGSMSFTARSQRLKFRIHTV